MRAPVIAAVAVAALLGASRARAVEPIQPGDLIVGSGANGKLFYFTPAPPPQQVPVTELALESPLSSPRGIAVDRNGLLATTDIVTRQLSRIDPRAALSDPSDPSLAPNDGRRALMAQFNSITSTPRGVLSLADGRIFVADPGIAPPNFTSVRGITRLPVLLRVDLVGGVGGSVVVAGCSSTFAPGKNALPNCGVNPAHREGDRDGGNFYFPSGLAVRRESPLEILVADAGLPQAQCVPNNKGRCHQSVFIVKADEPYVPGVNEETFCQSPLSGAPRSLAIDPADGSVLLTDMGDQTPPNPIDRKPPRLFRLPPDGCGADPPEIVYESQGANDMPAPTGIVVAHGLAAIPAGTILVADSTRSTVVRIDPAAHPAVSLLTGASPIVASATDLQIYDAGRPSPYFVADHDDPRVLAIDPHPP